MKTQNVRTLLPQAVIKDKAGNIGTVLSFGYSQQPPYPSGFAVKFENEKLARFVTCAEMLKYELR